MIHVLLAIFLLAYCLPPLAWWYQLTACNNIIAYVSEPLIVKRLQSKRFEGNLAATLTRQKSLRILFPMLISTLFVYGTIWYMYATDQPFSNEWELYGSCGFLAWAMIFFWKWRQMPIWQYNWNIELEKTCHMINLELIHELIIKAKEEADRIGEPKTSDDTWKLNNLVLQVNYYLQRAEDIEYDLSRVPKPIEIETQ